MRSCIVVLLTAFLVLGVASNGHAFNPCNPDVRTCE